MLQLPGEGIAIAIFNAIIAHRETMSQENRDRADRLTLDSIEKGNRFWELLFRPLVKALEKADGGA